MCDQRGSVSGVWMILFIRLECWVLRGTSRPCRERVSSDINVVLTTRGIKIPPPLNRDAVCKVCLTGFRLQNPGTRALKTKTSKSWQINHNSRFPSDQQQWPTKGIHPSANTRQLYFFLIHFVVRKLCLYGATNVLGNSPNKTHGCCNDTAQPAIFSESQSCNQRWICLYNVLFPHWIARPLSAKS